MTHPIKFNALFWLSLAIAVLALTLVLILGSLGGHLFGLDAVAPAVGKSPFGVGISEGGGPSAGLAGWIIGVQSQFSHAMTGALDLLKSDPHALWTLLGLSLAYGVFHAAGPGHGKAIIAAYGLANQRDLTKIVIMASAAALLQGIVAIGLVGLLAILLHSTAATMRQTAGWVEIISFGAVALLGAGLLWQKSRDLAAMIVPRHRSGHEHDHEHDHEHHHDHQHQGHDHPRHRHADHVHDEHCGHNHAPVAAAGSGLRGAIAAVIAAGMRPCSGSILILVFALSQGMFTIGIAAAIAIAVGTAVTTSLLAVLSLLAASAATRLANRIDQTRAVFVAKLIEIGVSAFVMALGLALLLGYLQSNGA